MSEKISEKLNKIAELQSIDTGINAIEKSKGNLPYLVDELKKEINEIKSDIETLENNGIDLDENLRESKNTIEKSKILLERYKSQRNLVTNNKEYEAIIKEIDFRESVVIEEEERARVLAEDLAENKNQLESRKKILESRSAMLSEKQDELEQKLNDTQEDEKKLIEKRKLLVAKIDKHLYNLYLRVYNSKGRLAVVPADEGFCGGCYTVLPSQKLSELRRRDSVVQCDACSRILYYKEEVVH